LTGIDPEIDPLFVLPPLTPIRITPPLGAMPNPASAIQFACEFPPVGFCSKVPQPPLPPTGVLTKQPPPDPPPLSKITLALAGGVNANAASGTAVSASRDAF